MSKRIVIVSDTQIPYDDRRAVKAVIRYIGETQPDEVVHIGDVMDYPTPSRWNKGTASEFALDVKADSEQAKRRLLGLLREVYDGPIGFHEGNHDLRPREYLTKYAPGLADFEDQFHFSQLLDFDAFGIEILPEFYKVAPGWITTHGHRGQIRLTQTAGATALGAAKKMGVSVAMGHTHRLGAVPMVTEGYGGKVGKTVWGMEVGNLMDMRQASYLKGGTANWQTGFGILTVDGNHVRPETIHISHGKFSVDGETWAV